VQTLGLIRKARCIHIGFCQLMVCIINLPFMAGFLIIGVFEKKKVFMDVGMSFGKREAVKT
jgi:hypothetical protein